MLISKTVSINEIISGTWKHLMVDLIICVSTYYIYIHLIKSHLELPVVIPAILGTALSFFIGFKNNQAYDRWWEARKIWGSLVNNSRSFARQVLHYTNPSSNITDMELNNHRRTMINRHIGFLYALKSALRKTGDKEHHSFISMDETMYVDSKKNVPNSILDVQTRNIEKLYAEDAMDGFQFLEMNKMIITFCDDMGKSERILNTVFPTTYNYYTRLFIWIFIISVTMVTANYVGHYSIAVATLIGYIFLTTFKIGEALVNPFENIPTGIPLNQITRTIEINLLEMMDENDIPEPVQPYKNEYVM